MLTVPSIDSFDSSLVFIARDLSESLLLIDLRFNLCRRNTVFMLVALRILRLQLLQLHPSLAESMLVQAGQGLRVTLLEPKTSLVYRTDVLSE